MASMSKAKAEKRPLPKRFYARAAFEPIQGGYAIVLDGKRVKTPRGNMLQCASQQLAEKIAAEWEAQREVIDTDTMPLTRLLNIALDRVECDRDALLQDIANYCETDLLFYRAPAPKADAFIQGSDDELALLQVQHFNPVLQWAAATYGVRFAVTEGVMPIAQNAASQQNMMAVFAEATDHELAALAMMVPLLGSALLALAIWKGQMRAEAALTAARLDEAVQEKHWGADAEVAAKWEGKAKDVLASAFFLTCNQL